MPFSDAAHIAAFRRDAPLPPHDANIAAMLPLRAARRARHIARVAAHAMRDVHAAIYMAMRAATACAMLHCRHCALMPRVLHAFDRASGARVPELSC